MGSLALTCRTNGYTVTVRRHFGIPTPAPLPNSTLTWGYASLRTIQNHCYGRDVAVDWTTVVFNMLTIKGIYGRAMYETWYKMSVMIEGGLDLSPIITHRFGFEDFQGAFDVMLSGDCGKVVINWAER